MFLCFVLFLLLLLFLFKQQRLRHTYAAAAACGAVEMTGSAVAPKSAAELRIIFGGHMLENQKFVKDLQTAMGNPQVGERASERVRSQK